VGFTVLVSGSFSQNEILVSVTFTKNSLSLLLTDHSYFNKLCRSASQLVLQPNFSLSYTIANSKILFEGENAVLWLQKINFKISWTIGLKACDLIAFLTRWVNNQGTNCMSDKSNNQSRTWLIQEFCLPGSP